MNRCLELVDLKPTVIQGNASEILALAGASIGSAKVQQYRLSMYRKHEDIEDRALEVKQRGKTFISPAGKHRGRRHTPVDDFLDVTSQRRSLYFPEKNLAVNPLKTEDSRKYHFYPSREWCDTDSRSIQAHGGGIIYVEETQTFYWYGENKDGRSYRMNRKGTTRQWRSNSKTNMNYARIEPDKNSWGWSWLEHWMAAKIWENRLMEQAQMDACEIQSLKSYDDARQNLRKSHQPGKVKVRRNNISVRVGE